MFFAFEGIDHVGKSTQVQAIAEWMRECGAEVVVTREPGGSDHAEEIRRMLLSPEYDWDAQEELLLFYTARLNHLRNVIRPALQENKFVLCDRFALSTLAYQSWKGLSAAGIMAMHKSILLPHYNPHMNIILDANEEHIRQNVKAKLASETKEGDTTKIQAGLDRFESRDKSFQEHVKKTYFGYHQIPQDEDRLIYGQTDSYFLLEGAKPMGPTMYFDTSGLTVEGVTVRIIHALNIRYPHLFKLRTKS